MVNIYSLKKKKRRIGKAILAARDKRASFSHIDHLVEAREKTQYKIKKIRDKKKVKK